MRRNLINIRSRAITNWFIRFYRFLVAFRSVNVWVFDCLIRKYKMLSLVNSWCLRNKLKLACDLKSSKGKLALFRTKDSVLLTHPPVPPQSLYFYFPSTTSTLHRAHTQSLFQYSLVNSKAIPPPSDFCCFLPPPPLFYCFSSSTTTTTFSIFLTPPIIFLPRRLSRRSNRPDSGQKGQNQDKKAKFRPKMPNSNNLSGRKIRKIIGGVKTKEDVVVVKEK